MAFEADSVRLRSTTHPLLGSPTLNIGLIEGGRQVNVVPDVCAIELDRRMLPGEKISEVLAHYRSLVDNDLNVRFDIPMLEDEALETSCEAELVRAAVRVAEDLRMNSTPVGVPFGTDASKFSRAGIPSIICGPGSIDLAHGAVEYIEIEQVAQAVKFYRGLMLAFI